MQINEVDFIYKTDFPDLEQMPKIGSFKYFLSWLVDKSKYIYEKHFSKFSLNRKNEEIRLLRMENEYLKNELEFLKSKSTSYSYDNITFLPNLIGR